MHLVINDRRFRGRMSRSSPPLFGSLWRGQPALASGAPAAVASRGAAFTLRRGAYRAGYRMNFIGSFNHLSVRTPLVGLLGALVVGCGGGGGGGAPSGPGQVTHR